MSGTDSLSNMGSVKYYKGFLNHAYSLNTINAQRGENLKFRVSNQNKFEFHNVTEGSNPDLIFDMNKDAGSKRSPIP